MGTVHEMRRANPWLIRTGFSARRNRRRRTTLRRADASAAGSAAGTSSIDIACEGSTMLEGATVVALPRKPSIMNSATTIRTTDRPPSRRFDPLVPGSLRRGNASALTGDRPTTISASPAEAVSVDEDVAELPGIVGVDVVGEEARATGRAGSSRCTRRPRCRGTGAGFRGTADDPCRRSRRCPASGFSSAHTMPASTADVTCMPVAFWCGASARASSIVSCEPNQ